MKEGSRLLLVAAPPSFLDLLEPLPSGVELRRQARGVFDVMVVFAKRRAELDRRFGSARRALAPSGGLWVAWPKKSSGVETDLSFESVQTLGLDAGLVDNKVCAIDEVWSGLRFVVRLKDRQPGRGAAG